MSEEWCKSKCRCSCTCTWYKDLLVGKTSKKSPLLRRMILLIFTALLGIYICFICIKQSNTDVKTKYVLPHQKKMKDHSCQISPAVSQENVYIHYPQPRTYNRKECACTPVQFFAILSMQRSGSGWFETLLNSHPNISSNGEVFSVKERRKNVLTILQTLDNVYNMDWSSSAAKNECSAAIGLKWMLNQGVMEYNREIVDYFNRKGVSVILLFRRNILRRLVSVLANAYDRETKQLNGTHKSHVHSKQEADLLATYKPVINVTFLLANLKRIEEVSRDALNFFKSTRHIVLYYEELISNPKKAMEVQEFLNVSSRKLESQQVKIHTRALSDQVQNWNEVCKKLKGTEYEIFLNESDYV
ncbi:hypothetical protein SUGI_1520690 [Cryptomeria japonica]|uniref:Sulfotransferase n=1 Tax=Cryptomeria japonica TaxID=3369 RepID=A0AAD3NV07_CRYJA|nr:uncharacterized protein LOC131074639 isoform X1 [Cryptomeria japonica]GLJ59717.1 hypothetical protein SUGI_1520690 [Cryptomeria japonica]